MARQITILSCLKLETSHTFQRNCLGWAVGLHEMSSHSSGIAGLEVEMAHQDGRQEERIARLVLENDVPAEN